MLLTDKLLLQQENRPARLGPSAIHTPQNTERFPTTKLTEFRLVSYLSEIKFSTLRPGSLHEKEAGFMYCFLIVVEFPNHGFPFVERRMHFCG